jgi:hypothetical protein
MSINAKDKALADAILKHLCPGRRICGVTFYAIPNLVIDFDDKPQHSHETHLSIEGDWMLFDDEIPSLPPTQIPNYGTHKQRISELICRLGYLGWHTIVGAELGTDSPYLLLKFANGQTLFINGRHELYESWHITSGEFMVVAMPGDNLAIWCPNDFSLQP